MPPVTSYFALKLQSEERERSSGLTPTIDSDLGISPARRKQPNVVKHLNGGTSAGRVPIANVFGPLSMESPERNGRTTKSHRPSFSVSIPPSHLDGVTPVQIATPPRTAAYDAVGFPTPTAAGPSSAARELDGISNLPPPVFSKILTTKWHTQTDLEIQSTISDLSSSQAIQSPAEEQTLPHPYHATIRVLSSTLENLNERCIELEQRRRQRVQSEERTRSAARKRVKALKLPVKDDVLKRILDAVFADEPEVSRTPSPIPNGPSVTDSVSSLGQCRRIV